MITMMHAMISIRGTAFSAMEISRSLRLLI